MIISSFSESLWFHTKRKNQTFRDNPKKQFDSLKKYSRIYSYKDMFDRFVKRFLSQIKKPVHSIFFHNEKEDS